MSDKTKQIRDLNDRMRQGDASVPGSIILTRGIADLLEESGTAPEDLAHLVRSYDNFSTDNDPHSEHDFGAFDFQGAKCFWKFDYYDPTLKWGSEDAADTTKTVRVLTMMLAEEY